MNSFEIYKKRADKIKKEFAAVQSYAESSFEEISKRLDSEVAETKYLVGATWLGRYTPDFLKEHITGGYKKGKVYNSKPNKDCDIVYLDKAGKLLYMRQNRLESRYNHSSYYRIEFDGYIYYLYRDFRDNEFARDGHPASFRAKYDNSGRLIEFITSCYIYQDYIYSDDGTISCKLTIPCGREEVLISNYSFFLENGKVRDLKQ